MDERVLQYKEFHNPAGSARNAQAKRRQDALERQKQQRIQAFSLTRHGLDDILDDLGLSSDEDEADGQVRQAEKPVNNAKKTGVPKRIKKKWKAYADRLMVGETLDMTDGLPADLCEEWMLLGPVPKGKRCMAVTFPTSRISRRGRTTNTLLLSRVSGRPLARHLVPPLPPDCVLDCVYVEEQSTLFVLDILRWKSQSMVEGEAEFRMFWRDSQLAELSAQTPPEPFIRPDEAQEGESMSVDGPPKPKRPPYLLVLPIPCLSSPLHPRQVLNDVLVPAIHGQKASFAYNARIGQSMQHEQATVEYETDGLTLLVKSACYESGLTPLAAWIPKVDLAKFGQLLEESVSKSDCAA